MANPASQLYTILNLEAGRGADTVDNDVISDIIQCDPSIARKKYNFKIGWGKIYPIFMAVAIKTSLDVIKLLSDAFPSALGAKVRDDNTLLHVACLFEPTADLVRLLLVKCPGAVEMKTKGGRLPLHVACRYKATPQVVELLLGAYPASVQQQDNAGFFPLHLACSYGADAEVVKLLVDHCPRSLRENKNSDRLTPLQLALSNTAPVEVVEILVKRDADAAYLPLHRAILFGARSDVLQLLSSLYPVALYQTDHSGRTPLQLAIEKMAPVQVVKLLLPDGQSQPFPRLLHHAIKNRASLGVVHLLAEQYPDSRFECDSLGRTPLHDASTYAPLDMVRLLAELCPAALGKKDVFGNAPGVRSKNAEVRMLLFTLERILFCHLENDALISMLTKDLRASTWRSCMAPILDYHGPIVHELDLSDGLISTLLHRIGMECRLNAMFSVVRDIPDLFQRHVRIR